jgi:hypothetical protein
MTTKHLGNALWLCAGALLFAATIAAQKPAAKPQPTPKALIFAVLDSGKRIEPIAAIEGGNFATIGDDDTPAGKEFATVYYRPRTAYTIVFGGAADGKLTIAKSNIGTECGGLSAASSAAPSKAKLTNLVMALATNAKLKPGQTPYRRRPTVDERGEIEKLVRAEFTKEGVPAAALRNLRYHNLTALDINGDSVPEFVGSYWIAPAVDQRQMLFLIAERDAAGKLALTVSDHSEVKNDDVMSGDVKDLDSGIGHELLLDVLDVDGDDVAEIFTMRRAFEGNNYHVYRRADGNWEKVHQTYRYRCAF